MATKKTSSTSEEKKKKTTTKAAPKKVSTKAKAAKSTTAKTTKKAVSKPKPKKASSKPAAESKAKSTTKTSKKTVTTSTTATKDGTKKEVTTTTETSQKATKKRAWVAPLITILLGVGVALGVLFGLTVYAHHQAKEAVLEYFESNDERRAEVVYERLQDVGDDTEVVLTRFDFNMPVYSQLFTNPYDTQQQVVEVNYLRRTGLFDYEVIKSYRVIVLDDYDEAVKLASERDLHIDNPDEERQTIFGLQDLDIPPSQREQVRAQFEADREQTIQQLQQAQQEYSALLEAIENGAAEFEGNPIPENFDTDRLRNDLVNIENELEKLGE